MAICGFCKNIVEIQGVLYEKKRTENTVVLERRRPHNMYSCPHCGSVLGITLGRKIY